MQKQSPEARIRYFDVERTFEHNLYHTMFGPIVDQLEVDRKSDTVKQVAGAIVSDMHDLEIVDSLDALGIEADDIKIAKQLGGDEKAILAPGGKAKQMNDYLRVLVGDLHDKYQLATAETAVASTSHLMIISQVRENIGAGPFQAKYIRSGGKALEFYASQICWLSVIAKLKKIVRGQDWPIGVRIKADIKKNKVAWPFRSAEFNLLFDYGVDDDSATLGWLIDHKFISTKKSSGGVLLSGALLPSEGVLYGEAITAMADDSDFRSNMLNFLQTSWIEIEQALQPTTKKKLW